MSISEQVNSQISILRSLSFECHCQWKEELEFALSDAADTIEALSAKLAEANEELERWHTDKVNEKIKNPFAWTSTLCCHNCDHKDEYIEELEAADMERSAEDCGGGWIYCGDGENLPKDDGFYLVTLTHRITDIADMRIHKAFFNEKRNAFMDYGSAVIAWKPLPEPYHEP